MEKQNNKYLKNIIKSKIKYYIMNEDGNIKDYDIVYRGKPLSVDNSLSKDSIWVTYDYDFAKEYGYVKEYKLPKTLNILDTDYYDEWESLVDEFGGDADYDEYKYEPSYEFIKFLTSKGYDGFMNGENILIFNKYNLS